MADGIRYLVAYEIRNPRRLRRVHRIVTDHGEPLQCSVFVCDLTAVIRELSPGSHCPAPLKLQTHREVAKRLCESPGAISRLR